MKKLLFIMAVMLPLFTFIGCSDDENLPTDIELKLLSYSKYDPSSIPNKYPCTYLFFDANNGEKFKEETIVFEEEDILEYDRSNIQMLDLLRHNEYELEDGTRVKPVLIEIGYGKKDYFAKLSIDPSNEDKWSSISDNIIKIPTGRYYVVAMTAKSSYGGWAWSDKYSGKYINVSHDMPQSEKTIEITFPHDGLRKGFIDWITTSW